MPTATLLTSPVPALEALDTNYTRWPGYNLPDNVAFQIAEKEYMKADEYDLFLTDPSDYIVRYWLPRVYGVLAPLTKLPPLQSLGTNLAGVTALFSSPEFAKLAAAMKKAGDAETKWRDSLAGMQEEMALLGFPDANLGHAVGWRRHFRRLPTASGPSMGRPETCSGSRTS